MQVGTENKPKSVMIPSTGKSVAIPDDAVEEGGFWWWVDRQAPDFQVWCTGGNSGPFPVMDENAEYPDETYNQRQKLIAEYKLSQ